MQPVFRIVADSVDITNKIKDRLLSLRITDEAGFQSDTVEIKLDDRDYKIEWPKLGAKLEVYIGYKDQTLARTGLYVVDEVEHSLPPTSMTIRAKAADMRESLKAPKSRSWDAISITDIVQAIAAQNSLVAKVSKPLGSIFIDHIDQTNESDLHFLTRIAKDNLAVVKPVNGYLVFVPRGEAKSVTGISLPVIEINQTQITSYTMTQAERDKYSAVRANYHDPQSAKKITIEVGHGNPVFTIRHIYPDKEHATRAALSKLNDLQRGLGSLSINMPGNNQLQAEGKINLSGVRDPLSGKWLIKSVEHQLDGSGFITRCECEIPND